MSHDAIEGVDETRLGPWKLSSMYMTSRNETQGHVLDQDGQIVVRWVEESIGRQIVADHNAQLAAREPALAEAVLQKLVAELRRGFTGGTEQVEDSTITVAMWADGYLTQPDGRDLTAALLAAAALAAPAQGEEAPRGE